ncbi:MAG: AzlD domain-containing protein, partial [Ilumatobacteraceae bacterium]
MNWTLVLALAAAAYTFKVLGLIVIGRRALPPALDRCLALIPAALIAALIVSDTLVDGKDLVVDARAAGVAAAGLAAWK